MIETLALLWRFKWQALLVSALGLAAWQWQTAEGLRADIAAHELADARAAREAVEEARQAEADNREKEREHTEQMAAIAGHLELEKEHALAEKDAVIAGLRDGTLRLRTRLAAAAATDKASAAIAGASCGHGAAQTGLRIEDAEFLVRESERADEVVRQLTACQAVIASDRVLQKP